MAYWPLIRFCFVGSFASKMLQGALFLPVLLTCHCRGREVVVLLLRDQRMSCVYSVGAGLVGVAWPYGPANRSEGRIIRRTSRAAGGPGSMLCRVKLMT